MGKGTTYSVVEKSIIQDLVQQNVVVENKRTDATIVHEKNQAWERITAQFNAIGDHPKVRIFSILINLITVLNK